MKRIAAIGLMASLGFIAFAQDPPAKPDDKASEPVEMKMALLPVPKGDSPVAKGYAEIIKAANEKLKDAKFEDAKKIMLGTADKLIEFAGKHPKDDSTLNGLTMAMGLTLMSPEAGKTRAAAAELIKTNFAASPAIKKELRSMQVGFDDGSADVVREVFKKNPDKLTRAQAAKVLINGLEEREKIAESVAKDEDARKGLESFVGKDALKKLIDGAPASKKEAETYRTALQTELKGVLPDLSVGNVAPETISVNIDGKAVKLSELKGKVVVLDFWATWCGPCRAMIPHTRELVKKMDGKPFTFVSVSVDDEKETLSKFIQKTPMPWTHWWDGTKEATELWEVDGFPTLYVIDHKGVIRFKTVGLDPDDTKFDTTVEELVKKAEDKK